MLLPSLLQLFNGLPLVLQLSALILDISLKGLNLTRSLSQFVLGGLKVGLRSQAHLFDLVQTIGILLLNLLDFIVSIVVDLVHGLSVVLLQVFNLVFQLEDLGLLGVNEVLVLSLQLIHLLGVLLKDGHFDLMELSLFLLMLIEQGLVTCSILQHSLRILILLLFELNMVLFMNVLDLLLKGLFHLVFGALKLLDLVTNGLLVVTKLILEFIDVLFLISGGGSLTDITLSWIL